MAASARSMGAALKGHSRTLGIVAAVAVFGVWFATSVVPKSGALLAQAGPGPAKQKPAPHSLVAQNPPEPVKQPETEKRPEPVLTSKPVKQPEPVREPAQTVTPVKAAEPVKQPEPVKPVVMAKAPEPAKILEPIKQPEPVKQPEPAKQLQPAKKPELEKKPEPPKKPEPAKQPMPVKKPEPVKKPQPAITVSNPPGPSPQERKRELRARFARYLKSFERYHKDRERLSERDRTGRLDKLKAELDGLAGDYALLAETDKGFEAQLTRERGTLDWYREKPSLARAQWRKALALNPADALTAAWLRETQGAVLKQ